jgi:hypothetical protein
MRTWIVAAVILAILCAGCGSSSPQSTELVLDDMSHVSGCTAYGHSYVAGLGLTRPQTFGALVCGRYARGFVDDGVSGSSLQSQLLATLQIVPRDASTQVSLVMWGVNDLGAFGPSLGGFEGALRLLVSRLRTATDDVHDFHDRAFSYTGRWTPAVGENVASAGAAFSWRSPSDFRGGHVAFMVMIRRGVGARYSFRVDGADAGTLDTRFLSPPSPSAQVNTPVAYRVAVPAGGGHVVTCRLEDVEGAANVVGWSLESARPPLVVLIEQPRLPTYAAYRIAHTPFQPDDAGVRALNRAIETVAREFDAYVVTVDLDRAFGKQQRYFLPDGLHPNAAGDARIASLIEQAVDSNSHVRSAR